MPVLRQGSRGDSVRELQTLLGITSDGAFGPQTHNAVMAYQRANGLSVDGIVGNQTWSHLISTNNSQPSQPQQPINSNRRTRAFTYGTARIIETDADNIEIKYINTSLRNVREPALSGSFFWAGNANAVVMNGNTIIGDAASHAWRGFGQGVLCAYQDGTFGVEFVKSAREIRKPVKWAIGGVQEIPFRDSAESGFTGKYADVHRYVTSSQGGHTWVGVKNGKVYLYWRTNCNRQQIRQDAIALGMQYCVSLDGGGSAGIKHPDLRDATTSRRIHHCLSIKQV